MMINSMDIFQHLQDGLTPSGVGLPYSKPGSIRLHKNLVIVGVANASTKERLAMAIRNANPSEGGNLFHALAQVQAGAGV